MLVSQKTKKYLAEAKKAAFAAKNLIESHDKASAIREALETAVAQQTAPANVANLVELEKITDSILRQILYNGINDRTKRVELVQKAIKLISDMVKAEVTNMCSKAKTPLKEATIDAVTKALNKHKEQFVTLLSKFDKEVLVDDTKFGSYILRELTTTPIDKTSTDKTSDKTSTEQSLSEEDILAMYGL